MRPERKKEIRSLHRVVPQLIKSGLVTQAFETERIIASTFEFSDDFISKLVGIPQNYIEAIQEIYNDILNKAYSTGYSSAGIKLSSVPLNLALKGEELDHEINLRMPIAFGVKNQLVDIFKEGISQYFETVPKGLEEVMVQFDKDLGCAYLEGIKDFLSSLDSNAVSIEDKVEEKTEELENQVTEVAPTLSVEVNKQEIALDTTAKLAANLFVKYATKDLKKLFDLQSEEGKHRANAKMMVEFSEWICNNKKANDYIPNETYKVVADTISKDLLSKLEKYAKLLGEGDAETVLRFTLGLGPKGKKATAETKKEEKKEKEEVEEKVVEDSTYARLEAYTKLLNSPEAERILRYTLGLPPKSSVTASYRTLARQVGPYDSQALSVKVQNLVDNHDYEEGASQTVVVECLIAGIDKMDDVTAAKTIASKLGIKQDAEDITLDYVERMADNIAAQLNVSTNLPGHFMFLETPEGDFCLLYNFTRTEPSIQKDEGENDIDYVPAIAKVTGLPNGPQGVLTKSEQAQIEALMALGKSKTYRDIKKASPKLAVHIGKILNDMRMSKIPLAEGVSKLRGNTEDLIADCFGSDGQGYYQYLRNN